MSTILIADASSVNQQVMGTILFDAGFQVHTAENGYEALTACVKFSPDLVLVDHALPGLPGTEVCHMIRSQSATKDIAVVLMAEEPQALLQAPYLGAQGTLIKPVQSAVLVEKVTTLLAPCPEPSQPLNLRANGMFIPCVVQRVMGGTSLILLVARDMALQLRDSLDSRKAFHIEYEPDQGVKVNREVFVTYVGAAEIHVNLSSKISIEHRRRHFRKPIDIPIHYRLPGELVRVGRTLDISGGGIRLTGVRGKPELGMAIDLQLMPHPDMRLSLRGVVRRVEPSKQPELSHQSAFDVGVEFEDLPVRILQQLIVFLFS